MQLKNNKTTNNGNRKKRSFGTASEENEYPEANRSLCKSGTILKGVGGLYTVISDEGTEFQCRARGIFRHESVKPLAGDRVAFIPEEQKNGRESNAVIDDILPRKNFLIRPPLANIDILFTVIAAAQPEPSTLLADKLITIAEFNKIEPVIVITKSDLDNETANKLAAIYRRCNFSVFVTSSNEKSGLDELKSYIRENCCGKISTFSGVSGAGKSTLMNSLFPILSLETGELSEKIERGKNTTRHVELFPVSALIDGIDSENEGYIADTPGFSMIDFTHFDFYKKEDLPFTFREFENYLTKCRFTKCTHTKEQGCAIAGAVENGEIPVERLESYRIIYSDLKDKHDWD